MVERKNLKYLIQVEDTKEFPNEKDYMIVVELAYYDHD